jgi:hypothetical protein
LQTILYQVDIPLRGSDTLRGFLPERMNNPELIGELHCVNNTKRVPFEWQRDFEYTRT